MRRGSKVAVRKGKPAARKSKNAPKRKPARSRPATNTPVRRSKRLQAQRNPRYAANLCIPSSLGAALAATTAVAAAGYRRKDMQLSKMAADHLRTQTDLKQLLERERKSLAEYKNRAKDDASVRDTIAPSSDGGTAPNAAEAADPSGVPETGVPAAETTTAEAAETTTAEAAETTTNNTAPALHRKKIKAQKIKAQNLARQSKQAALVTRNAALRTEAESQSPPEAEAETEAINLPAKQRTLLKVPENLTQLMALPIGGSHPTHAKVPGGVTRKVKNSDANKRNER